MEIDFARKDDLDKLSDRFTDSLMSLTKEISIYNANQRYVNENLDRIGKQLQSHMEESRAEFYNLKLDIKAIPLIINDMDQMKTTVQKIQDEIDQMKMETMRLNERKDTIWLTIKSVPRITIILGFIFAIIYVVVRVMPYVSKTIGQLNG